MIPQEPVPRSKAIFTCQQRGDTPVIPSLGNVFGRRVRPTVLPRPTIPAPEFSSHPSARRPGDPGGVSRNLMLHALMHPIVL